MKIHKRRDDNEGAIVLALRAIGAFVCRIEGVAGSKTVPEWGVPDLCVGYRGRTILLEVKNPDGGHGKTKRSKPGDLDAPTENAKGQLTPKQVEWWKEWTGGEAHVVETPERAVAIVRGSDAPRCLKLATHDTLGNVHLCIGSGDVESMSPAQADTLAGAIHEAAGFARGASKTKDNGHG